MTYYIKSDIHIDFYIKESALNFNPKTDDCTSFLEKFYEEHMKPADGIIIAGDVANDEYTYIAFMKWIATKYKKVYVCPGNHDFVVVSATVFNTGHPTKFSEDRWTYQKDALKNITNIVFLDDGELKDGFIAGTYGACDLSEGSLSDNAYIKKMRFKSWFDGTTQKWRNYNTGYAPDCEKIFKWQYALMEKAVSQKPKIMVTHFCPSQLGQHPTYENSSSNAYFFFNAIKLLEEMPDGSIWICGHIHNFGTAEWINSKGNKILIIACPMGYPSENPMEDGYVTKYKDNSSARITNLETYTINDTFIEV